MKVQARADAPQGPEGSVFRLRAQLRNNRLIEAREALGHTSAAKAARELGLKYPVLVRYESLGESPLGIDGDWKRSALKVASAYGKPPEWFWPAELLKVERAQIEARLDTPPGYLEGPAETVYDALEAADNRILVGELLARVPESYRTLLTRHYNLDGRGELKVSELAAQIGLSDTRTNELLHRGLVLLRNAAKNPRYKPGPTADDIRAQIEALKAQHPQELAAVYAHRERTIQAKADYTAIRSALRAKLSEVLSDFYATPEDAADVRRDLAELDRAYNEFHETRVMAADVASFKRAYRFKVAELERELRHIPRDLELDVIEAEGEEA